MNLFPCLLIIVSNSYGQRVTAHGQPAPPIHFPLLKSQKWWSNGSNSSRTYASNLMQGEGWYDQVDLLLHHDQLLK